jgi:acetylornithine deacetylase/succinyl-diaminopimelate desuccinylase-like protein
MTASSSAPVPADLARAGDVRAWLAAHSGNYLERLRALVRVRSVSADPASGSAMRFAAELVAAELRDAGLPDCEVAETGGHPVVLAARRDAGPGRPTILVYLHYDVQPEDELTEWSVPPFEAVLRDGRLIGRGSADDKGPILMLCAALRGLAECGGDLPVNLIVLVDGEEESGSRSLPAFLDSRDDLSADLVVISDTRGRHPRHGRP